MKIFVFNPEHDLCIANGNPYYMAPQSAIRFAEDCYGLMQYLCDENDVCVPASRVGAALQAHPEATAIVPWGWNDALAYQLRKQGVPEHLILDHEQIGWYIYGSERKHTKFMADVVRFMIEDHCSETPEKLDSLDECKLFLQRRPNIVLKCPLSGSGRGIRPIREILKEKDICWIERVIKQHRYVMAEPRYQVVQDFAALFSVGSTVRFEGYSIFDTKGFVYESNLLLDDEMIRETLEHYLPASVLDRAINNAGFMLERKFGNLLRGKMGVDMFIFEREDGSYGLNPMVELNCRYTMGFVAHEITRRHPEHKGRHFKILTPTKDNPHYSYSIE